MIIFAAGNKYKVSQAPKLIDGNWFVFAQKYIKSQKKFNFVARVFNIGPHYEIAEE